jgi:raffinose/stachyose/melibiose transport system substrate-binding protein
MKLMLHRGGRASAAFASLVLLTLVVGAGEARPAKQGGTVTISMLRVVDGKTGWDALIANFEKAYPSIKVNVTYELNGGLLVQIETTEIEAGNAPDLLFTTAGCASSIGVCELGKAGDLAPMGRRPWAKRSLPFVTAKSKYGGVLVAYEPSLQPYGVFTNDDMFRQLGLKVPQTFPQLLDLCGKAKAGGKAAVILAAGSKAPVTQLIMGLAVATLYGKDPTWTRKLRAGKVTFEGSRGWHQALQHFIDMNDAGCFQPGAVGVQGGSIAAQLFAEGQGLMFAQNSGTKGSIDAPVSPQFGYSFRRFPGGTSPTQTTTTLNFSPEVSVNAHSSAGNQRAAQTFVDFIARPQQNALGAQLSGTLTQQEFLKGQLPAFMSSLRPVFAKHRYVLNPDQSWWNQDTLTALQDRQTGLITGQYSVDDVLKAMDAAWKRGPR